MEKAGTKTRDIKFFSQKNNTMMTVHTPVAQEFARYLEEQPWVASYDSCVPLQMDHYPHVSPVDIRAEYFQTRMGQRFCAPFGRRQHGHPGNLYSGAVQKAVRH